MKRIATWLRRIADEIDPPPKRGRKPRRAERNAAAVDSLFANSAVNTPEGTVLSAWTGTEYLPVKGISDLERPHGWPQEPHWTDGPPPVF